MPLAHFLLWGGVIAGPLFIIAFVIEGALRKGYDPMRQPVSALSVGPRGWVQQANFFANSILLLACAYGMHSILIGIYGAGLFGAGAFVVNVNRKLHDLFSLAVFLSLTAACFVFAHVFAAAGESGWEAYSSITGTVYFCGFLLFAKGFSLEEGKLASVSGLLQRLTISVGAIWLSLVALHLLGGF